MDARGTLHERHHTTLQPDVLIVESGPSLESRMPPPDEVFGPSAADDPKARLLALDVTNSSTLGHEGVCLEARGEEDDRQVSDLESSISPAASEPGRSWDETYRFRKRFGGLPALDTLDVMRESSKVLRRQSDILTSLTAAFIVPVSVIILTHVLVTRPVIQWLETRLEVALFEESVVGAIKNPYTNYVFLKVAEFLVTSVLCIPVAITLAVLSKAGIVYTVASTYAGVKVSFVDVLHRVTPRVWLPLVITYASSCLIFVGGGFVVMLCLGISNGIFAALQTSSATMLFFFAILGLIFGGIFVYLKIIVNVASVVCILEDKYGFAALARSFSIVQGRFQVALGSYLVTFLCGGFLTLLFEFRVTDRNAYTEYNASGAWEGPLLVLMHSFVYLFDDIMATVFYFTCPRSLFFDSLDASGVPEGAGSIALT